MSTILIDQMFSHSESKSLTKAQIDGAERSREQIINIMNDYRTALSHISKNDNLSDKGQQQDIGNGAQVD